MQAKSAKFPWTDELHDQLYELVLEGKSFSQIGEILGTTKNTVNSRFQLIRAERGFNGQFGQHKHCSQLPPKRNSVVGEWVSFPGREPIYYTEITPVNCGRLRRPPAARFAEKIEVDGDCWNWIGSVTHKGYGNFSKSSSQRSCPSHRFSYELFVGPIPDGLEIDHLCRNRRCVNPDHLEAVSGVENIRRGTQGQYQKNKTHCKRGHEFIPENTYVSKRGSRGCKECRKFFKANYRRRLAERFGEQGR